MVLTDQGKMTPSELARELLRQRDVLLRHSRRLQELRARITEYERRFGIPSADVHDAIERGDLTETDEVCEWIIDYELLLRAKSTEG